MGMGVSRMKDMDLHRGASAGALLGSHSSLIKYAKFTMESGRV